MIVPGNHDGFNSHRPQLGKTFLNSAFHDVLQMDDAQNLSALCHDERGSPAFRNSFDSLSRFIRELTALLYNVRFDRIRRSLTDATAVFEIHTAHPGLCCKRNKG